MTCPIIEDVASSIYLLVSKDKPFFKIGNYKNTIEKLPLLEKLWGQFDLDRSIEVVCGKNHTYRMEKTLHFIFEADSIDMGKRNEGYTEWFDIECLNEVIEEIERIKQRQIAIKRIKHGISLSTLSIQVKETIDKDETNTQTAREIKRLFSQQMQDIKYINVNHGLIILDGDHRGLFLDIRAVACDIHRGIFSTANSQYRQDKKETSMLFHLSTLDHGCTMTLAGEILESYFNELEKEIYSEPRYGEVYLKSIEDFYRKKLMSRKKTSA